MTPHDSEAFSAMWSAVIGSYGRKISDEMVEIDFYALEPYTLDQIRHALTVCKRDPDRRFAPTTNDVIREIDGSNQLPTATQLIGMAMAKNTPIGMFARLTIGHYALTTLTEYDLQKHGERARAELPEFIERARRGQYTPSELNLMRKNGVSAVNELCPGIKGPPESIHSMIGQSMKRQRKNRMARGINKVILVGNLGADPETRYMPSGGAVTNLSIATSESWTDKNSGQKQERTEWHRVTLFNRLGEIAAEYCRKGSQVYIEGSIRTDKYQDKQTGEEKYSTQIIARELQLLGGKGDGQQTGNSASANEYRKASGGGGGSTAQPAAVFDDDIPFSNYELRMIT